MSPVSRLRRVRSAPPPATGSSAALRGYAFRARARGTRPRPVRAVLRGGSCSARRRAARARGRAPALGARRNGEARRSPTSRTSLSPRLESARLEERRVSQPSRTASRPICALGRHGELTTELEQLIAAEPLRERLRAQLMLALYRAGRQGDALAAYRNAARTLDAELGFGRGPSSSVCRSRSSRTIPTLQLARTPTGAAPRPAPRRATATILFTDARGIDGAARASRRRARPTRSGASTRAGFATCSRLHGGREVKALGDGLMVGLRRRRRRDAPVRWTCSGRRTGRRDARASASASRPAT